MNICSVAGSGRSLGNVRRTVQYILQNRDKGRATTFYLSGVFNMKYLPPLHGSAYTASCWTPLTYSSFCLSLFLHIK